MTPAGVLRAREAFVAACRLDVAVRKPGNVSNAAPGHGMRAEQFVAASLAAAGPLFEPGLAVGVRIERAAAASWQASGCNTNLGIVLLCAPLAAADERRLGGPLQAAVQAVLNALTVDDARAAYRAIAATQPGGLGRAAEQDVHDVPDVDLRSAMALAADRDTIARAYATGLRDVFDAARAVPPPPGFSLITGSDDEDAHDHVVRLYLHWLAREPDSHIVRKHGPAVAQTVMTAAQRWRAVARPGADPAFAAWDDALKAAGINPGTSADLTVATLLTAELS
jgi:triphosphoribosyl-dephospho-CoA synthase